MPAPPILRDPLPYADALAAREMASIDTVVIHCTELPDLATARDYGERILYPASGTGNSGHYYIDRDGSIVEYVPPGRIAHHTRGWNPRSIGIELVNTGRYPHWLDSRRQAMDQAYTEAQIESLIGLLAELQERIPSLVQIAGHEDLDLDEVEASDDPSVKVRRKRDPGPLFPWARVLAALPLKRL
ncbi:N-acetylmuramoyl-L-alanine amidase [Thermomonas carbonis]|uniref:N-acetylmuramoyl-L-alanine amidase n=1 Tax=Thermomonas carbonis TaxID=1463158 RepID=A0A7G9SQX5_9GAMM|nr:N-acetylmuramoyl-L-alanine amidase [Thermomonas carbonis]QNN70250.1 N-acetylmuramoyl-L-alanine amidase [Thermomonas carbonis]GHB98738.1 N-acetylmuramoyl-L-alanine amidase [Thermomonas carbonis]